MLARKLWVHECLQVRVCVCVCVCVCVRKCTTQGDKESHMGGLTWSLMSSENLMKQLLLPGPSVSRSEGRRWRRRGFV